MAKALSSATTSQINKNDILTEFTVTIDSIDRTSDVLSYTIDSNRDFGCKSLTLILNNDTGKYSPSGSAEIYLRDSVVLTEKYGATTDSYTNFTGYITQRNIQKSFSSNTITLTCLDYIVKLQETDLDEDFEASKYLVENEVLTPNYLPSPNQVFASVFDYANTNLATNPPISIRIRNKLTELEDPQWNGFEIEYEVGQCTLGAVLNALYNYELVSTYYFYPKGLYAEDVIEDILTQQDAFGKYLFEETTAQGVIDNHLTETFYNADAKAYDTLTRNTEPEIMDIETTLTTACAAGDTTLYVTDTSGFPTASIASVNGDTFSYTGKTSTTLTGLPSTGTYAVRAHPVGSYVVYTATFPINQIWYLSYDNLISVMSGAQFTIPGGYTMRYFDKRYGRILLDSPVPSSSDVRCNYNYSFKTLQASGIEITLMKVKERNEKTRFDAINKLRNLLPPNYLVMTEGDSKIWSKYLNQKNSADYALSGIKSISYGEDQDLFTRTVFYGKNRNPHNIFFDSDVGFNDTGETYTATTSNTELRYAGDEGLYRKYKSGLSTGIIKNDLVIPVVYVNNVAIDNKVHEILQTDVVISSRQETTTTTTEGGWSSEPTTETHTYYTYKIYFSHRGLVASQPVYIYGPTGTLLYTLGPNDGAVDYADGVWSVPGSSQNETIEQCSTASYFIMYSTDDLQIDYANATFLINRRLIPNTTEALVTATFEYQTVSTPIADATSCFDGRWDTQTQTTFYAKPPQGFVYASLDLGAVKEIELIDIIAGFYKPDADGRRKFEMTNYITIKYSIDNVNYFEIASETSSFALTSGKTKSFDEKVLGENFQARYFRLIIEDMEKIDYNDGLYAIALVEIAAYSNVVLRGECKLIPTTELTSSYNGSQSTISVKNTTSFPSGSGWLYLDSGSGISVSALWYSGKTSTSFTGITGAAGIGTYLAANKIYDYEETDTSLYDNTLLLEKMGDALYKNTNVNEFLDTQEKVDKRAKDWLKESVKDHTMLDVDLMYAPHLRIGHTVSLNDPYNNTTNNYFVEKITSTEDGTRITIARYP